MAVVNPNHLFDKARRLAMPTGGGAPRQADLRRARSTAYVGVFHAVLTEAADDFVGRTKRQTARYALVYRSVNHRSVRDICENILKPNLPARYSAYVPRGGFGPEIKALATAVVELQEKRHVADYDPLFRAKMLDAQLVVLTGRLAVRRFRRASEIQRKAFLSLVVFPPR